MLDAASKRLPAAATGPWCTRIVAATRLAGYHGSPRQSSFARCHARPARRTTPLAEASWPPDEPFDSRDWLDTTIDEFISTLDAQFRSYNEARIKISLGSHSPIQYRWCIRLAF